MTNSVAQIALLLDTESYRLHLTLLSGSMAGQTGHATLSDALPILADLSSLGGRLVRLLQSETCR